MYAKVDYYKENYNLLEEAKDIQKYLEKASIQIDILTYSRIGGEEGYNNLTPFQKAVIKDVCCQLAEFIYENEETLNNPFTSYSINGVSMNIGESFNVHIQNGICIPNSIYQYLRQTGLTTRILY